MKTLVVYYSRTGNAKFTAEKIAQELGADIEEVIDEKNRMGVIGFLTGGSDATQDKETKISETKKNPKEYDLIVIGTPVWNGKPAPAIRTYLRNNELSGKKVAIFCTGIGIRDERAVETIKELTAGSDFTEQLLLKNAAKNKADTEDKISEWCRKLRSA